MITIAFGIYAAIGLVTLAAGVALLIPGGFESSIKWRWWAVGIAITGAVYSVSVGIQQSSQPGMANLYADRISLMAVLVLIALLEGLGKAYWGGSGHRALWVFVPIHSILSILIIFTDLIIPPVFEQRTALPMFGGDYWEPAVGVAQVIVTLYLVVASGVAITSWWLSRDSARPGSGLFVVGFLSWLALGINDALSNLYFTSAPPTLSLGFLLFVVLLVFMAFQDSRYLRRKVSEFQARATAVLTASPHPVLAFGPDGNVLFANPALGEALGYDPEEVISHRDRIINADDQKRMMAAIDRTRTTGRIRSLDVELTASDGDIRDFDVSMAPLPGPFDELEGVILNMTDVTERRRHAERSEYLALHDPLTGLMNRTALNARLEELIAESERYPDLPEWAVLFMDLDKFKSINDTLGHAHGDRVLVEASRRITSVAPRRDLCFRLGGDEFVVVVTGLTEGLQALTATTQLIDELNRPMEIDGVVTRVTASVGITVHPSNGTSVGEVLRNADLAMYAAKEVDEPIRFFTDDLNRQAMEQMHLELDLQRAIERSELDVHYQRIVDRDGNTRQAEALLRWQHPDRGAIPPAVFIPIAERSGLIVPIGEWVIRRVFADQKRLWSALPTLHISINVSPVQLRQPDIVATIRAAAEETGTDPSTITLEITETALVEDLDVVGKRIEELRQLRFTIAIDDFGTGYSSLSYLATLPVDSVKFDRTLAGEKEGASEPILRGLVRIVNEMNLKSVIEGIESTEQSDSVRALGDVWMQGFHYHRPLPVDELLQGGD